MDDIQGLKKVRSFAQPRNLVLTGHCSVWPSIALHLEFNPRTGPLADAESPET